MKKFFAAMTGMMVFGAANVNAASDPLIEGAKFCTRHLPHYERQYAIPTHLLSAIATTESGRYHNGLKLSIPWPWTINAEGKGYYYDTKSQAIAAARKFRAQGIKSIDVGCMQVNLHHHPNAFSSLDQAFDPQENVAYAAKFLRGHYNETRSWKQAAANYHSKTPTNGTQYAGRVYNNWYTLMDKLRAARIATPSSPQLAENEVAVASNALAPAAGPVNLRPLHVRVVKDTPKKESADKKTVAAHATPRMNSIKVTRVERQSPRDAGVIHVRPDIKVVDAPVTVTHASGPVLVASADVQTKPVADMIGFVPTSKVAHVNAPQPSRKQGPNFIFSD